MRVLSKAMSFVSRRCHGKLYYVCGTSRSSGRMCRLTISFVFSFIFSFIVITSHVFAATYQIAITDRLFTPKKIAGAIDQPVTITVYNKGTKIHNFILPAFYIYSPNLSVHHSTTVQFTPDKKGVFQFYSDAGGTKEPGLVGEIDVQ